MWRWIGVIMGITSLGLAPKSAKSQVTINGYASVTGIAGNVLTLSNVSESSDTFEDGEEIIIMQMQDSVIGGNTGNNASFGSLADIASAGLYEILTIASHTESSGLPNTITISGSTANTYSFSSNSTVQIISYPHLGSPDYTTTNDLTAMAWNGSTGGVLAFAVPGTLTVAHSMSVDGLGFRGAAANGGGSQGCSGGTNFRNTSGANWGDKGEGIFLATNSFHVGGQAPLLNGGGGANSHNGGGGGGGNFSVGGTGGPGWPNCSPTAGGYGGIDLSGHIGVNRIFMGGGGGSGEGNNAGTRAAEDGGGIILIKATEVRTTGSCGGNTISASGNTVMTGATQDGNSGGGAGGSIVFEVANWNVSASCTLAIVANGGNGGDVSHGNIHGAGGGGGHGAIIYADAQPTTNVTTTTEWGVGGKNCNSCGSANPGGGVTTGDGVVTSPSGPLPIELLNFLARPEGDVVSLMWATASELNNDFFTIQKSVDQTNWETISIVSGAGYSTSVLYYNSIDDQPANGLNYYRLVQTDYDGRQETSPVRAVSFGSEEKLPLLVFPNPASDFLLVESSASELADLHLYNAIGQEITNEVAFTSLSENRIMIDVNGLKSGMYTLSTPSFHQKVIKQ